MKFQSICLLFALFPYYAATVPFPLQLASRPMPLPAARPSVVGFMQQYLKGWGIQPSNTTELQLLPPLQTSLLADATGAMGVEAAPELNLLGSFLREKQADTAATVAAAAAAATTSMPPTATLLSQGIVSNTTGSTSNPPVIPMDFHYQFVQLVRKRYIETLTKELFTLVKMAECNFDEPSSKESDGFGPSNQPRPKLCYQCAEATDGVAPLESTCCLARAVEINTATGKEKQLDLELDGPYCHNALWFNCEQSISADCCDPTSGTEKEIAGEWDKLHKNCKGTDNGHWSQVSPMWKKEFMVGEHCPVLSAGKSQWQPINLAHAIQTAQRKLVGADLPGYFTQFAAVLPGDKTAQQEQLEWKVFGPKRYTRHIHYTIIKEIREAIIQKKLADKCAHTDVFLTIYDICQKHLTPTLHQHNAESVFPSFAAAIPAGGKSSLNKAIPMILWLLSILLAHSVRPFGDVWTEMGFDSVFRQAKRYNT